MKAGLRRFTAWLMSLLLVLTSVPALADTEAVSDYSDPLTVSEFTDEAETYTVTFTWSEEYTSHIWLNSPNRWANDNDKPIQVTVPAGTTIGTTPDASMPDISIRNLVGSEVTYQSIYRWADESGKQFTANTVVNSDKTIYLVLFPNGAEKVSLNFVCGCDGRHTVYSSSSLDLLYGQSLSEDQIPATATPSQYCKTYLNDGNYRFAGTWHIAKAPEIQLTSDVVFSQENVEAWKFEYSDSPLIDVAADWEVRVGLEDVSGNALGEIWVKQNTAIGERLPSGYSWTLKDGGTSADGATVINAPVILVGSETQQDVIATINVDVSGVDNSNLPAGALDALSRIPVGTKVSDIHIPGFVAGEYVVYADGTRSEMPFDHWEIVRATQTSFLTDILFPSAFAEDDTIQSGDTLRAVFASVVNEDGPFTVNFSVDNNVILTVENVEKDTSISNLIKEHADDATKYQFSGTFLPLKHFRWNYEEGATVTKDTTLVGELKLPVVTFDAGEGIVSLQAASPANYGGTIDTLPTVTAPEGQMFVEWRYDSTEGQVKFDSTTPVYEDMKVWAYYVPACTVTFYSDSDRRETLYSEQVAAGTPYTGTIPTVTPPANSTLRYWVDMDANQVFNASLPVNANLNLYPVFEKYSYVFVDENGTTLTSAYEGGVINYNPEAPEGKYYVGLKIGDAVIPNGTAATASDLQELGVTLPQLDNGKYTFTAEPQFADQHTIVFHPGTGAQILASTTMDGSYSLTVNDSFTAPGALDIVRTDGTTGISFAGWASTEGSTVVDYQASAVYNADPIAWDGNNELHLYPVWERADNTIAVTFQSNYPKDAVDSNGEALQPVTYVVYVPSGSQPIMPTLAQAGMTEPANTPGDGTPKYCLSGWSIQQDGCGNGADNLAPTYGVYNVGAQYQVTLNKNTTFYAIWIDSTKTSNGIAASFFIRADGNIPQEPGGYSVSDYYPESSNNSYQLHTYLRVTNALRQEINIVNDPVKVAANIQNTPGIDKILNTLPWNVKNAYANRAGEALTTSNYGTVWTIEWYACKLGNDECKWHVDGRIRILSEHTLTYWPNGGTNKYIPASETHKSQDVVTVAYKNNNQYPQREGFTFVGWDYDADADPFGDIDFPVDSSKTLTMPDQDVDLYAVWKPNPIKSSLVGEKHLYNGSSVMGLDQGQFTFEIKQTDAGSTYSRQVSNTTNGTISFGDFEFTKAGLYHFEIREIPGTDSLIAYDGAVYTVTIYVGETNLGLQIVGQSVSRNNTMLPQGSKIEFNNYYGTRNITVSKVWEDSDDQDGLRPSAVTVTLYKNGGIHEVVNLSAANGWAYTWTNLPIQDVYSVQELPVPSYTTEISGDVTQGFVVTNEHEPAVTTITATKVWNDNGNTSLRPQNISLTLSGFVGAEKVYSEPQTITADSDGNWRATWKNVPVYKAGQPISYSVSEPTEVAGYTSSVDGFVVTNTLKTSSLKISKQVTGGFGDIHKDFTFQVKVQDAEGNNLVIAPGSGYTQADDNVITFYLSHNESVTLNGIPSTGVTVLVKETNSDGYSQKVTQDGKSNPTANSEGWYQLDGTSDVMFTNDKPADPDTGVVLDSLPYIIVLAVVALGVVLMVRKRRHGDD